MDVSGGSGQPRSGNDESAEPHTGSPAPAAGPAHPDSTTAGTPEERRRATHDGPDGPSRTVGEDAGGAEEPRREDGEAPQEPAPRRRTPAPGTPDDAAASGSLPGPGTTDPTASSGEAPDEETQNPASPTGDAPRDPETPNPAAPADGLPGRDTADRAASSGDPQSGEAPDRAARAGDASHREAANPAAGAGGLPGRGTTDHAAPADGLPGRGATDRATPADDASRRESPNPAPAGRREAAGSGTPPQPAPGRQAPDDHDGQAGGAPDTPRRPAPRPAGTGRPGADEGAHGGAPAGPAHSHPHRAARSEAHSGTGPGRPPQRRPEPGGGLLMGRPFGVPVYVAPSWFLVAALITWVFGGQLDRILPELGAARYLVSLFFAVAFYASVLVHELAHTVAALRFKLPVRRIQLQFFGGVSEIEKEAETPGREFVLAFVGPLLSLVLAGVFYAAMLPVEPGTVPGVLLAGLMISNLIVAVFNLLPGLPLDGGRMLRAVVWKLTGRPMSGTVAAAWVGRALAVSVLIGLPLLTQSGALGSRAADNVGMDTLLDALLAAILAAIIWTGAGNSLRMARLREHLPELRARALTRRAVPVPGDTPLSEALRRANASGARALVVVDGEGRPMSLVREAAIVGVPEHRRPWVPVSGLAQDLTDGMRVSAELTGEELLDALRAAPATEYLVVEETGEIYGVLSAADVERAFVKAMARPS
ncbi:site-2 protease family protein [Streptomyces sp. NPDC087512]|uniref:site-2 protease family protein n=1 Tax=Streptomyces sp. NPDC087512 TaxID=3155059 RepID=UPI0034295BAD